MKEILAFIEHQKQGFSKLPLLEFLRDKNLDPRQRLSFAPCMTHFIMSFGDINSYILRDLEEVTIIQEIVNQYTYEDDKHWPWFITDIENLGFDTQFSFTQGLRFIWGEDTKITRRLSYYIAGYASQANPVIKILVIKVLEATADVFFSISSQIASELQATTKKEYLYFGNLHLDVENDHTMSTSEAEDYLRNIELTDSQRQEAINAVEAILKIFTEWTYELLAYAQNHPVEVAAGEEPKALQMVCV